MKTTTIGAYPKPEFLPVPDWFRISGGPDSGDPTTDYSRVVGAAGGDLEALFEKATHQVVRDQVEAGIDIPTDPRRPTSRPVDRSTSAK